MAVVLGGRSTLNPDAPVFIPAAFRMVEDFSPEWWELVKTSTWFHDYWLNQHQEEKSFDGNDEDDESDDITNLLPESFDLGIGEELANMNAEMEELEETFEAELALKIDQPRNALEMDAEALMKNLSLGLSLKSSKERGPKTPLELAKYREKPVKCMSPKCSPRRIHQPR